MVSHLSAGFSTSPPPPTSARPSLAGTDCAKDKGRAERGGTGKGVARGDSVAVSESYGQRGAGRHRRDGRAWTRTFRIDQNNARTLATLCFARRCVLPPHTMHSGQWTAPGVRIAEFGDRWRVHNHHRQRHPAEVSNTQKGVLHRGGPRSPSFADGKLATIDVAESLVQAWLSRGGAGLLGHLSGERQGDNTRLDRSGGPPRGRRPTS